MPALDPARPLKCFFVSTSLEHSRRGIESFFRECFDALHGYPGLEIHLFKGSGELRDGEHRVWCLNKFGLPARLLGKILRRNAYTIEQRTFLPGLVRHIRRLRPDVVFTSDINLVMRLHPMRGRIGVPFRLMYSNGAPVGPPFNLWEHVQQVTPAYYQQAIDFGEPPAKHTLVPYGVRVPAGDPAFEVTERFVLRSKLQLPIDRQILLSVGWISGYHKRMDYLIREVAALPQERRPFVVLLGEIDGNSPPIIALAKELLGNANHAIRSVPYAEVGEYYRCTDVFALCSLVEGFGRVYLEALIAGLPCLVHDSPVMRYVLGEQGSFGDLSQPGMLTQLMEATLPKPPDMEAMKRRRDYVRAKFGWDALRPEYASLLRTAAAHDITDVH